MEKSHQSKLTCGGVTGVRVRPLPLEYVMDHFDRVISNQVRFGYGYQLRDGSMIYYAWHGYPNRNDDYFTVAKINN